MPRLSIIAVALLTGCAALAQTPPQSAPTHGVAYVDVRRIEAMPQMRGFYAAYDREAASLKATQSVPQLTDTRPIAKRQAQVVQNGAREANATLAALRSRVARYEPREDWMLSANVRSQIVNNYAREASAVRSKADESTNVYRSELNREANASLAQYRASLDSQVNSAYAARAQQLHEKESDLEIKLMQKDSAQDMLLRLKLQNLKAPQVNRAALRARLNGLESREDAAVNALRAKDAATLAAYRAQLVASASRDYASMGRELQAKAQANWQVRQRVAQAQLQMPQHLTLGGQSNASFGDRLIATANGLRDYVRTRFNNDATTTGTAFTSASADIAQRFSTIASLDTDARGSSANEIIALQRQRSALSTGVGSRSADGRAADRRTTRTRVDRYTVGGGRRSNPGRRSSTERHFRALDRYVRESERGFTLVEMVIAVAIAAILLVAGGVWMLSMRPGALRGATNDFDSALAVARQLAATSGNGATLAFLPRPDGAQGFLLRVYSGRPNAANAVTATNTMIASTNATVSEATYGSPPFAIFLSSAGYPSGKASYPSVDGSGNVSFPVVAKQPPCPANGIVLTFTSPQGVTQTRSLQCNTVVAGAAAANPSPTPNPPRIFPPSMVAHWTNDRNGALKFKVAEFGYTHWFAKGDTACDGITNFANPNPYGNPSNPNESSQPPSPPNAPYSYPNTATESRSAGSAIRVVADIRIARDV